ncbi:hypothetical protein GALMADRAFT_662906 [Galerina marginata CBS 339.88]|uniref:Uncharacterized protein n=1 Tax=Galerina marginata (strain CBS 339.88) TaxID=685588 RepID=A0A067TXC5_GALM3|nr:hypothetical protein GALMADRAFT_662906 [Galerina marginata CBS 339.88]
MSASPPRLSSPFATSGTPRNSGTPVTPNSISLGRIPLLSRMGEGLSNSPTNTFSESSSGNSLRLDTSTSGIRILDTPRRRVLLRSDPSISTCFDPADKELYDLWAPKQ